MKGYQIKKSPKGSKFFLTLIAKNGQPTRHSYNSADNARGGIEDELYVVLDILGIEPGPLLDNKIKEIAKAATIVRADKQGNKQFIVE